MRTRKLIKRNYRLFSGQKKREHENNNITGVPVRTKDGKGFRIALNDKRTLNKWMKILTIRYWEHLQEEYTILWNDIMNKDESIHIETEIRVLTNKENDTVSCEEYVPVASDIKYIINVFHRASKILVRGYDKEEWTENEFTLLKSILDESEEETIEENYKRRYNLPLSNDNDIKDETNKEIIEEIENEHNMKETMRSIDDIETEDISDMELVPTTSKTKKVPRERRLSAENA